MKNLLIITLRVGYENVSHAGGKIHYYYINKLDLNEYDVTIIANEDEQSIKNVKEKGIKAKYIVENNSFESSFIRKLRLLLHLENPFDIFDFYIKKSFFNYFINKIKILKKINYSPDIVILDWTQSIFLAPIIRKYFPNSYIIGCEQDVTFLRFERLRDQNFKFIKRIKANIRLLTEKKWEIKGLKNCNKIITFSEKDKNLLLPWESIYNKVKVISPYFDNFSFIKKNFHTTNLLFYGAMSRPENYESCIWFIENVFKELHNSFTFTILGSNPPNILTKYSSNRIFITGFVKDVTPYFSNSLCLVAPLNMGAGIKIKILESFSAGLPVLTNEIGIEGIPAIKNKDYFHCKTANDYINSINLLYNNNDIEREMSMRSKSLIQNNYDYSNQSYL